MDNVIHIQALHVAWCALLYALLTVVRAPAVWGIGKRADGSNPFDAIQPKISANLSNQFEWPLFFHILCVVLLIQGQESHSLQVALAWLFIVGRVLHSAVQILGSSVRLRGLVFMLNFVAVLAMWAVWSVSVYQ